MSTADALQPDAATQEVSADLKQKWISVKITIGGQDARYVTLSSLDDRHYGTLDIAPVDDKFRAVSAKAVIRPQNIKPRRVMRVNTAGTGLESGFISKGVEIPNGWKKVRSKRKRFKPITRFQRLAYVTINGLKIGALVRTGGAKAAAAETYKSVFGFEWATEDNINEIVVNADFPKVPKVLAENGLTYPIDPSKIDEAKQNKLTVRDILYTNDDALIYMGFKEA